MQQLYYRSTRGGNAQATAAEAIIAGIAPDGGLYVPAWLPSLQISLEELLKLDYQGRAFHIMKLFLPDFSEEELLDCIDRAYGEKFSVPGIAPLTKGAGVFFLELFHGPTQAFKDMALTILPHLLKIAAQKQDLQQEIVILTATSGDTGKAALEGFSGVQGTKIIVFFPESGVSPIQKRQMVTQTGDNTHVIGIDGNFDDAQRGVKGMFTDIDLLAQMARHNFLFSSANSINIGRLIPQTVYYFHAYLQACAAGDIRLGDLVNFAVPTGNFGNILAGYYAKKMGLPIKTLLCAANENNVLADFFTGWIYDKRREFVSTMSPSMDILVSSNLERLLYNAYGENAAKVKGLMRELGAKGWYQVTGEAAANLGDFYGGYASEADTAAAIKEVFAKAGYLIDPHTAVAYAVHKKYRQVQQDETPTIVVSTASPFKFARDVMASLDLPVAEDDFDVMQALSSYSGIRVPAALGNLKSLPVRHRALCPKDRMRQEVEKILWK